jgi:hypothetical protein
MYMKDQIITFETARLAKEKGFWLTAASWRESMTFYDKNGRFIESMMGNDCFPDQYYAPTQSLLQKWLREKHNMHVYCIPMAHTYDRDFDHYCFEVFHKLVYYEPDGTYSSYEEALEAGLVYALNLIK